MAEQKIPIPGWLQHYPKANLPGDLIAGFIVAIMLVPQGMAYALLAGLPPEVGLYASILPGVTYGLIGSIPFLSVGPVAIDSLLVASSIAPLAAAGSPEYLGLALLLALMVGIFLLGMGLLRVGFLANFLSQTVITAFTSAAALIIGLSQVKHLLGVKIPNTESFFTLLGFLGQSLDQTNLITLGLGLTSITLLIYANKRFEKDLHRWKVNPGWILPIIKSAPLLVVLLTTLLVWEFNLAESLGVNVVGTIPAGLPPLTIPNLDPIQIQTLIPSALTISLIAFMESFAVGKSLASRKRQKVDPDQHLIGLGISNLAAAFSSGYPVTGGISRSVVNYSAGANTGLASIFTSILIALTVLFLMPLFFYLPQATLAAIILVAVSSLVDFRPLQQIWRYDQIDAGVWILTFLGVLGLGIQKGIGIGILASLLLYLWRSSRPHIAVVGQVGDTEHYRNILRHQVKTFPGILAIRVDESLFFANTRYLENFVLNTVAEQPDVHYLLLICSAINFIDGSALETLFDLIEQLRQSGVGFYLAEVKGPVMDRLQKVGFMERIGSDHIFLSTHQAMQLLSAEVASPLGTKT